MTIPQDLLEILVCPENHLPLQLADDAVVARVNSMISSGKAKNHAGNRVEVSIEGGLIRSDQKILYPIRDEIPVLLIEEGILLDL